MTRIAINAQLLSGQAGYRRAGIHTYIAQVLAHLPRNGGLRYRVYTPTDAPREVLAGMDVVVSRLNTARRVIRILWEQTAWPRDARRQQADILHSMAFVTPIFNRIPTVITVFDLSFELFGDRFPLMQRLYLQTQTRRSCRRAREIIVISESSKADVVRLYDVDPQRVHVIYPGVSELFRPLDPSAITHFKKEKGLPNRFLLHVGTLQPRKNIPVLLRALAALPDPDVHLVLVGGKGWLYDEIFAEVQALGLAERVHFAGYVADEDLPLWYNSAEMLIFPSVYEGFGLPPAEAMACGTPVIVADSSSLPEVVGDAGLLFAPHDVEALTAHISALLKKRELRDQLSQRGIEQASRFTWQRAGDQTAAVYRRIQR